MEEHTYPNKVFRYGGDEFIILFYEEVNISEEMTFFRDKIRKIQLLEKLIFLMVSAHILKSVPGTINCEATIK